MAFFCFLQHWLVRCGQYWAALGYSLGQHYLLVGLMGFTACGAIHFEMCGQCAFFDRAAGWRGVGERWGMA